MGIRWFQLSLLGGTEELNNQLMGGYSYQRIWNALSLLKDAKFGHTVCILLLEENEHELDLMEKQMKENNIDYYVRGLLTVGRAWNNSIKKDAELYKKKGISKSQGTCGMFISIMADGQIQPCAEFNISLGNIIRDDLKEIWNNNQITNC